MEETKVFCQNMGWVGVDFIKHLTTGGKFRKFQLGIFKTKKKLLLVKYIYSLCQIPSVPFAFYKIYVYFTITLFTVFNYVIFHLLTSLPTN